MERTTADAGHPRWEVPRLRLLAELDAIDAGGLGVVVAPAGCGKSTLLRQFVAVSPADRRLVVADDLRSWLAGERLPILGGGLVDLVVDDADPTDAADVGRLRELVESWTGPGRLVLASRRRFPFVVAPRSFGVEVHCFGEDDLGFDPDELAQLGAATSDRDVQDMVAAVGRWPAGVGRFVATPIGPIGRYLDTQVLSLLDPDEIHFLGSVAALAPARADLVNAALNRDDVIDVMSALRDRGLPLLQVPTTSDGLVVIAPQMQERLIAAVRRIDPEYLDRVVDVGVAVAERAGEAGLVFAVCEQNGRRSAMADVCLRWADALASNGRTALLRSWLQRFTEEEIAADPRLRLAAVHSMRPVAEDQVRAWLDPLVADDLVTLPDGRSPAQAAEDLLRTLGLEPFGERARESLSSLIGCRLAWQAYAEDDVDRAAALLCEPGPTEESSSLSEASRLAGLAVIAADLGNGDLCADLSARATLLLGDRDVAGPDRTILVDVAALRAACALGDLVAGDELAGVVRCTLVEVGDGAKLERLSALVACADHFALRKRPRSLVRALLDEAWEIVRSWSAPLPRFERDLARLEVRVSSMPLRGYGARDPALSPPELRVLRLLASHHSVPEIAEMLGVSLNTVKTHRTNVYRKLRVDGRDAAVRAGLERGLIPDGGAEISVGDGG